VPTPAIHPLVDRPGERARLEAALEIAARGQGGLVVLTGKPGVGKSWLVRQVLTSPTCPIPPDRVRWSSHRDARGAATFSPWPVLLGPVVDGPPPSPTDGPPPIVLRLFELCREGPLALVLDDLDRVDGGSLRVLAALASTIAELPLFVVATTCVEDAEASDGDATMRDAWVSLLGHRDVSRIELGPWSASDVECYASALLGSPPRAEDLRALELVTQGNAHRVVDTLNGGLVPGPLAATLGSTLPASLEAELVRRVGALGEDERHLLELLAIFGTSVPWALAMRLADGLPDAPALRLSTLDEALATRLIGPDERTGHLRFLHPVVPAAVLRDVPPVRLARLHGRAGELLAEDGTQRHAAARIARHFVAAAILPEYAARAVPAATLAGYEAELAEAHNAAADHYREALDALSAVAGDARDVPSRRAELLIALGHALAVERPADAEDALGRAESIGAMRRETDPAWSARVLALAVIVRCERLPPRTAPECRSLLARGEAALDRVGPDDRVLRARLASALTPLLRFETDRSRAWQQARDALRAADEAGDATARGRALEAHHWALLDTPAADERLGVASEILRSAEATGDLRLAADARTWRYLDLLEIGRIEPAEAELVAIEAAAESLGEPRRRYQSLCLRAGMSLHRGLLGRARALAREAIALGREFDVGDPRHPPIATLIRVAVELGESLDPADLERLRDDSTTSSLIASSWPFLHRRTGRTPAAEVDLAEIKRSGFDAIARGPDWLPTLHNLAWSAVELGDREASAALYAELEPRARGFVVYAHGAVTSSIARLLGNLARVLGRLEIAQTWLDQALAWTQASDARCDLAHAYVERAAVRIDSGLPLEDERVQADLRSAVGQARALGLIHAARRVAELDPRLSGEADLARRPPPGTFRLRRGRWTIRLGDRQCELRDQRGLQLIAALLARPGEEVSAIDLVRIVTGDVEDSTERARARVTVRVHAALDRLASAHIEVTLHLRQYLRTGKHCGYLPTAEDRIDWDLGDTR